MSNISISWLTVTAILCPVSIYWIVGRSITKLFAIDVVGATFIDVGYTLKRCYQLNATSHFLLRDSNATCREGTETCEERDKDRMMK